MSPEQIADRLLKRLAPRFRSEGTLMTYAQWQRRLAREVRLRRGAMDPRTLRGIVDAATAVVEDIYVHLDLKRRRHGLDPVQQLKVLRENIDERTSERVFHFKMLEIFKSLGDMHTAYRLPDPYIRTVAFLPLCLGKFSDARGRFRYVVTHALPEIARRGFAKGTQVTSWNGIPITAAVRSAGAAEEGSNQGSHLALGVQAMTVKWLGASLEPDSPAVIIGYRHGDEERTITFPWLMLEFKDDPRFALFVSSQAENRIFETSHDWGIHLGSGLVHRTRMTVFKGHALPGRRNKDLDALGDKLTQLGIGYVDRRMLETFTQRHGLRRRRNGSLPSLMPLFFEAWEYHARSLLGGADEGGRIGYIRIRAFPIQGPPRDLFLPEFRRLLNVISQDGLILDVRDNPGGSVTNAESALQFLLPRDITPLPFRFLASPVTRRLVALHRTNYRDYEPSLEAALDTGGRYSAGLPLTDPVAANNWGQQYFGPVVLLTNAGTYSAADIFSAGFEDHGGTILNTDATTGAGGANVWFYDHDIAPALRKSPLAGNVNLQVAVRQCARTGKHIGIPIEEIGVPAIHRHSLTRDDLLSADGTPTPLLRSAASLLSKRPRPDLNTALVTQEGRHTVTVTARMIDRLDFYLNDRPVHSADVGKKGGTAEVSFPSDQYSELVIRAFVSRGSGVLTPPVAVGRVVRQLIASEPAD